MAIDVIKVEQLADLRLYLNNSGGYAYQSFAAVRGELPACERMLFCMNAGMFHSNYQPVGLYVAQGKQISPLNTDARFWQFSCSPMVYLAWNAEQAWIGKTANYAGQNLQAAYATQSGPMLVINHQINPQFLPDATSKKIRNGVGIRAKRCISPSIKTCEFLPVCPSVQRHFANRASLVFGWLDFQHVFATNRQGRHAPFFWDPW